MDIYPQHTNISQGKGNDFIADVSDSCINRTVKKAVDAGSCNFCSRPHRDVNVITGESHLEVRLCNKCLKELSKYR